MVEAVQEAGRTLAAIALAAALGIVSLPRIAHAQSAAAPAPDRCEGTLCDLYYATRPAPAAGTANGATTAQASSGGLMNWFSRGPGPANAQPVAPATATNNYMALGAGGVLGARQERCSGTLCDLYYGSSPTDTAGARQEAAAGAAPVAAAQPVAPHRHIVHESETRPQCSSPTADPWRCYR